MTDPAIQSIERTFQDGVKKKILVKTDRTVLNSYFKKTVPNLPKPPDLPERDAMESNEQNKTTPSAHFMKEIEQETGIKVSACYQCKKCTNGCPVTFAMDIYPDRVIRLVQLGQEDTVLNCNTIWICSACETCTTRCPNEVDIAGTMDCLKERAIRKGVKIPQPKTAAFHQSFLGDIRRRGRVFEGGLMMSYMLKSGEYKRKLFGFDFRQEIWLGWNMFKRGRMPLYPKGIKGKKEIKKILK